MKIPGIGSFGERTARAIPSVFAVSMLPHRALPEVRPPPEIPAEALRILASLRHSSPPDWAQIYARMDRK